MRLKTLAVLALFSAVTNAGVLSDKVDRFTGERPIAWNSVPGSSGEFALTSFTLLSKASPKPTQYSLMLTTWSNTWQYLQCNHTNWLVDGEPAPWIATTYKNDRGSSAAIERFTFKLDPEHAERLATSEKVEFKVCNTEGEVRQEDLEGLRQVIEAAKQ